MGTKPVELWVWTVANGDPCERGELVLEEGVL